MNTVAAVVLAFFIGADPDATIQGNWYGVGMHKKCSIGFGEGGVILTVEDEVLSFLEGENSYRIGEGEEIDFMRKGEVVRGRYLIKGDGLALLFPSAETLGERPPESMQTTMVKWGELTRQMRDRVKRGETPDEVTASMPEWYWRLIFFKRTPPAQPK